MLEGRLFLKFLERPVRTCRYLEVLKQEPNFLFHALILNSSYS